VVRGTEDSVSPAPRETEARTDLTTEPALSSYQAHHTPTLTSLLAHNNQPQATRVLAKTGVCSRRQCSPSSQPTGNLYHHQQRGPGGTRAGACLT
jgi:hypothetical protein